MIVNGVLKYFKSLSVGNTNTNNATGIFQSGGSRKTTLIYVTGEEITSNNILEIDATIDFNISMETKLIETPAENQIVYTNGALKQPKTITIKCYLELDKLSKLKEIYENITPLWVVCEKPIPSTINQKGYYSDASTYALQSINIINEGYYNCVACTLVLKEIRMFEYRSEYLYNVKNNKIDKNSTNRIMKVGIDRAWGHTAGSAILGRTKFFGIQLNKKIDETIGHNLEGNRGGL